MEGFLHHMAPQFLHPALQTFGCGAFRSLSGAGAFHPLYPSKALARHFGEQYALGQSVGQAFRLRDDSVTPPLYRHNEYTAAAALAAAVRDDASSPGSAASASPRPCKDEESQQQSPCTEKHHEYVNDGERKSSCGVCGTRLSPGVAQAHFIQELQHLYSLSALPSSSATHHHHHHDEDARWETYQRIRANRQRRLKLRTRKRHHTVESMLDYDLEPPSTLSRSLLRPREPPVRPQCDTEDEPVDVEGDSMGWPEPTITHNALATTVVEKEAVQENEKQYPEDLEISSTNDNVQSPERVRIKTPQQIERDMPRHKVMTPNMTSQQLDSSERPSECVSTTEVWASRSDVWQRLTAENLIHTAHKRKPEENLPSSTDPHD